MFNNSLTGGIPESLGELQSLKFLNFSCNNLTGAIPASLLARLQQGKLTLGFDNETHPCTLNMVPTVSPSRKKNNAPIIAAASGGTLLLLLVVVFIVWRVRKQPGPDGNVPVLRSSKGYADITNVADKIVDPEEQLEVRQFTYTQLAQMSNNFANVIGKGGFGIVYLGNLERRKQVAIKLHNLASQEGSTHSSEQGIKELLAETNNLKRIHHRNLVSLVGYCIDGPRQALVYEYMPQGNLMEHLRGIAGDPRLMQWGERVRIAVEAAQGLEYLHKGCNPSIIHRDIKPSNILLNDNLEAKISDFGLSRAFKSDQDTHVTTGAVAGSPGYIDPEFNYSMQLTAKSDVYSFGIVLLELITGQPAIIRSGAQMNHIVQWVAPIVGRGEIDQLVDKRLRGEYDVNSVWKVVDLAFKCTARASNLRPTMSEVLTQLKECSELVNTREAVDRSFGYSSEGVNSGETCSFEIGFNTTHGQFGPSAR